MEKKLSFVIPCYNSASTIGTIIERIIRTVTSDGRFLYEIICVNDYSPDNTFEVLKEIAKDNSNIKAINFSKNFGQHAALMAGFHFVTGDIVVCLDDDGETPPEKMFLLIDKLEEGYDLVSAKYKEEKRSFIRKIGTKISFAMSSYLVGKPKDIDLNSFYVFRSYIAKEIINYKHSYPFVHGLILRATRNMANVEIERSERIQGSSGYNFKKLLNLWMNGFTAFSEKPLRVASVVGCGFSFVGFLFALFIIIRKIIHPEILVGYSSLMATILIVGGMNMLFAGLLGEYIGRIYISINNAPQYVIKEQINTQLKEEKETNDHE